MDGERGGRGPYLPTSLESAPAGALVEPSLGSGAARALKAPHPGQGLHEPRPDLGWPSLRLGLSSG